MSQLRDETYIIDLCDAVLQLKASRQHRFDFLLGDPNARGRCARLPVDAYYPELQLVIEYHERQHTETVAFFDQRTTLSGVGRGEQRRLYDQRRRDLLPENGIALVELGYGDFEHKADRRLARTAHDREIVALRLAPHIRAASVQSS